MEKLFELDLLFYVLLGLVVFGMICFLVVMIVAKNEHLRKLKSSLTKLNRSFDELDQQARLIVKTDLELHKAQEELDRRLNGLNALQKISRLITTTLDESEIFKHLDAPLISELGFEKHLILVYERKDILKEKVSAGFAEESVQFVLNYLEKDADLIKALKEGHSFSSINSPKQRMTRIVQIFDVEHFILTPIITQNGLVGLIFVGNKSNTSSVTQGDEEALSILANQIGQSLENARLFEEVFHSRQVLESKVQDRTKQLASALEEVQKISKTKSEFISAVSHELRTPLTSIKGYAAILMSGKTGEIPLAVKERLEKINKHSDNLVKMINDLLDISRIESGRVHLNLLPHKISSIVDNVGDLLTPQMKDKSIQWKVTVEPQTPLVPMDSALIERVFINLVSNAIKFTPPQGTISVKVYPEKDYVINMVSDTGIGIKAEDAKNLFEEFYRVDNEINKTVKGTGLGLALAKNIVEAHKGRIWVKSEVNAGTTFYFTIPLTIPEAPQNQTPPKP